MSEELMNEELTNTEVSENTESMADYEDQIDNASPWNRVKASMEAKEVLTVKVEGVVKGGVIAMVEGIRGFIPASRLSLSYVENLDDYLLQDIEVRIIEADQAANRLILSAREILRDKERASRKAMVSSVAVNSVVEGVVDSIQNYGAFIKLENGLSGLVHISQISNKRIKTPEDVLKVGDTVTAKVIKNENGKISLSMKALEEAPAQEPVEKVVIPKAEKISTNLGDLLKGIKLN